MQVNQEEGNRTYKYPHVDDVKMARGFQVYLPEGTKGRELQILSSGQI